MPSARMLGTGGGLSRSTRTWVGFTAAVVAIAMLIVGFTVLQFHHRISDRVDVPGEVVAGVELDVSDGQDAGYWQVDYMVDGTPHTGIIQGTFHVGQKISVSAPGDGSVFTVLTQSQSLLAKIASWIITPGGAILLLLGIAWIIGGFRSQHRADLADALAAYGLPPTAAQPRGSAAPPDPAPAPPTPDELEAARRAEQFHRPYDI